MEGPVTGLVTAQRTSVAALTWVFYDMLLCLQWTRDFPCLEAMECLPLTHSFIVSNGHALLCRGEFKGRHSRRIYVIVRYFSILNLAYILSFSVFG